MGLHRSFLFWCCLGAAGAVVLPARVGATPTAQEIITATVARDKVLIEHRKSLDADLEVTREKLNDEKEVVETSREQLVVEGDHRPDYKTRPDDDKDKDKGKDDDDPEHEAKKAAREEPFELLNIIDHYSYTLEGTETVDGVECYKIAFTPKPDMPYNNREEKVLNAVSGHIWVSTKDYSLIKDKGSLTHPVSVAWIFATLREMEFQFDAMLLPNGDYGPRQVQYRYLVNIPFMSLHERDTRRFSNYRRIDSH